MKPLMRNEFVDRGANCHAEQPIRLVEWVESPVAPRQIVFKVGDRLASALARIASANKPRAGGGFTKMTRADMINIARIACAVGGIKCSPGAAWAGERAPMPFSRPKKIRLSPRQGGGNE